MCYLFKNTTLPWSAHMDPEYSDFLAFSAAFDVKIVNLWKTEVILRTTMYTLFDTPDNLITLNKIKQQTPAACFQDKVLTTQQRPGGGLNDFAEILFPLLGFPRARGPLFYTYIKDHFGQDKKPWSTIPADGIFGEIWKMYKGFRGFLQSYPEAAMVQSVMEALYE
jgi:hypothetical protein